MVMKLQKTVQAVRLVTNYLISRLVQFPVGYQMLTSPLFYNLIPLLLFLTA